MAVQSLIPKGTELVQIEGLPANEHLITIMQLKHDYVVLQLLPFMKVGYSAVYISVPNLKIIGHYSETLFTSNLRDYTNSLRSYFFGLPYAYPKKVVDIDFDGKSIFQSEFVQSHFETDFGVNQELFRSQLPQFLEFFTQPFLQTFPNGKLVCADFQYETRSEVFEPVRGEVVIQTLLKADEPASLLRNYQFNWQSSDLDGRAARVSGPWKLTPPRDCLRYR